MLPGDTAAIQGYIYEKEYRKQGEITVPVLYLKDVYVSGLYNNENHITGESAYQKFPYKVMCYMKNETDEAKPGTTVVLQGKVRPFSHATNSGEFDSRKYYQILGVGGILKDCTISTWREDYRLIGRIYRFKSYLSFLFHKTLSEEDASVMDALILGNNTLMDADTKDLYKRSGIIHILAISGLHVSLLGMGVFKLLRKCDLPIMGCALAAVGIIIFYGAMTGFGPSARRAITMFVLQMAAYFVGRTYDMPTGLMLAAFLILLEQPLYLFHSGFLLSFSSVAALYMLQKTFRFIFPKPLVPGMAIFFGTMPVQLWFSFCLTPYSMFLNMLIVPCMPIVMILGLLLLMTEGLALEHFAAFPAGIIHLILRLFAFLSQCSLKIPGHTQILGKTSVYRMFMVLTMLVIAALFGPMFSKVWNYFVLCAILIFVMPNKSPGLQITAVDVGQGDCFFVSDEKGTAILIDGGSSSKSKTGTYQIEPYLKCNGIGHLDAVFISHLDEDHYNGIKELIELTDEGGVQLTALYLSATVDSNDEKYIELNSLANNHHINIKSVPGGMFFHKGHLELTCLYPYETESSGSNENSMVLYLKYKKFSALFTGDLEGVGETKVIQEYREKIGTKLTLLKVAHHGSKNSTGNELLSALRPAYAIISAGEKNSYGHPHEETLFRLESAGTEILRTDKMGEITLKTDGKRKIRFYKFLALGG